MQRLSGADATFLYAQTRTSHFEIASCVIVDPGDDPSRFAGKRVLVVGMGNSAMDIASDLSLVTEQTILSVRHGSWVVPKRLLGKPADQAIKPWAAVHVPWKLRQPLALTRAPQRQRYR